MRVYHFSEQPYPYAWRDDVPSLRVNLPNGACDPKLAADLYNRYLDEWMLADELGFDIMINEHHSTATCMTSAASVILGILARQTRRARLLVLGYPIANRLDPIRAAEELAMVDVISRGRLDMGFVKGVPYELPVAIKSAVRMMDRFWEAHDLIIKAMTTSDHTFNWDGEYFQYRHVNLWPRPYQAPHPPVWVTGMGESTVRAVAQRGYVIATMLNGYDAKNVFDTYRKAAREAGRPEPGPDRFAYLAMVAVARSEAEAHRRAEQVAGYVRTSATVHAPYKNPPGYFSPRDNVAMLRAAAAGGGHRSKTKDGRGVTPATAPVADLIDAGLMFAGTPDQVYDQICYFNDRVGGLGNLLMMGQGGWLNHADTTDSLTLFAKEVLPRLQARSKERAAA